MHLGAMHLGAMHLGAMHLGAMHLDALQGLRAYAVVSVTVKVAPPEGAGRCVRSPCMERARERERARPRPRPGGPSAGTPREKGVKREAGAATPGPASVTVIVTEAAARAAVSVIVRSGLVRPYFSALSRRLP